MGLEIGSKIGDYEIIAVLDAGGMGEVESTPVAVDAGCLHYVKQLRYSFIRQCRSLFVAGRCGFPN